MEITPEVVDKVRERFKTNQFPAMVGIEIDSIENGRAQLAINVTEKHLQLQGIMHGGAIATLVDTAGSRGHHRSLGARARASRRFEMKINYLSPIKEGRVVADAD
jgi:acyl-CoA thioesterase